MKIYIHYRYQEEADEHEIEHYFFGGDCLVLLFKKNRYKSILLRDIDEFSVSMDI